MTTGEKLAKLRRENNYTQEQLSDLLGVSRQSVSKWESDLAYPETDKLLKLGEIYSCSMDYLLKDGYDDDVKPNNSDDRSENEKSFGIMISKFSFERKSKKEFHGLPLWHINIGFGRTAKGIIAVGLKARGVISIGLLSLGVISCGILTIGVLSFGILALGLLSLGAIAAGIFSVGAISFGILAIGAIAIGDFSIGALAIGKYFALGDHSRGMIAIGKTFAQGDYIAATRATADIKAVTELLDEKVPKVFSLFKEIIKQLF